MKYRVAVFRRSNGKLQFKQFQTAGFAIRPDGQLIHGGKVCNTTDRRKIVFYEINYKLPKQDRLGNDIYERDIVFDSRHGALSIVSWNESGCAFVLCLRSRGMTVKYRYCDFRDSVEVIGNEYENNLKQITAKGLTK